MLVLKLYKRFISLSPLSCHSPLKNVATIDPTKHSFSQLSSQNSLNQLHSTFTPLNQTPPQGTNFVGETCGISTKYVSS